MHKRPGELGCQDLKRLIVWIDLAVNLLEDDQTVVSEYVARLRRLAEQQPDAEP